VERFTRDDGAQGSRRHRGHVAVWALAAACGPIDGVELDAGMFPSTDATSTGTAVSWGDSADGSNDAGERCTLPAVDPAVLGQLAIDAGPFDDVARGTSRALRLTWIDAGYPAAVDACVAWSILPAAGASINDAGLVSIDPDAAVGVVYTVTADIEQGRRVIQRDLTVYEPIDAPIVGTWSEGLRLGCDDAGPFAPSDPVGELVLHDNGDFQVTWVPFEVYYDYWGTYVVVPESGTIIMSRTGGNLSPEDFDGVGTATVSADGTLELGDMYLGTRPGSDEARACGHLLQ